MGLTNRFTDEEDAADLAYIDRQMEIAKVPEEDQAELRACAMHIRDLGWGMRIDALIAGLDFKSPG